MEEGVVSPDRQAGSARISMEVVVKMKPCIGWLGRIFGHKIERLLVAEIPTQEDDLWTNAILISSITGRTLAKRKWKVVCTRCGLDPSAVLENTGEKNAK